MIARRDDGRVLLFGVKDPAEGDEALSVAASRLDADGALDTSFGDSGIAVVMTGDPVMPVVDPMTEEVVGFVGTQITFAGAALSGSEAYVAATRHNLEDGSSDLGPKPSSQRPPSSRHEFI